MKKVFLFLSIFILALSGFVFACGEDKYDNIKISAIVKDSSGKVLDLSGENDDKYYEVDYNDTFTVEGILSASNDINKRLIIESSSNDTLSLLNNSNTEKGSIATFKANAPTNNSDSYYTIKLVSYESKKNSTQLKFKVVLPVKEIKIEGPFGVTASKFDGGVDLSSYVTYVSDYNTSFMTTQKGVSYELLKYYERNDDGELDAIGEDIDSEKVGVENGKITVIDNTLNGKITVAVKSNKYIENYGETLFGTDKGDVLTALAKNGTDLTDVEKELLKTYSSQVQQYNENEKLKKIVDVYVVKGLSPSDVSLAGSQIGKNESVDKLDALLYLNTLANYTVDSSNTYSYLKENVNLIVKTSANVNVSSNVVDGSVKLGSDIFKSSPKNINIAINGVDSSSVKEKSFNVTLSAPSNNTGYAFVDFKLSLTGIGDVEFANSIDVNFSDLYNQVIDSLTTDVPSGAVSGDGKIKIEVSALPTNMTITQENIVRDNDDTVNIYDSYDGSYNGGYGTKFTVSLGLGAGLNNVKIKDSLKKVKVFVGTSDTLENLNKNISFYNYKFQSIDLLEDEGNIYFELDLAVENNNCFYVKAKEGATSNTSYEINFVNQIKDNENISVISAGTFSSGLADIKKTLTFKLVKGVNEIRTFAKTQEIEGNTYQEVDYKYLTTNDLYKKVTVKVSDNSTVATAGSLIGIFVNEGAVDQLTITVEDPTVAKVLELYDTNDKKYSENFTNKSTGVCSSFNLKNISFLRTISVVGLKAGETKVTLTAGNGTKQSFNVKVVKSVDASKVSSSMGISINTNANKNIVTQNTLNKDDSMANDIVSVKLNGTFNIENVFSNNYDAILRNVSYRVVKPDTYKKSGIVEESSDIVNINNGVVFAKKVGQAIIVVNFEYYVFESLGNGFFSWSTNTFERYFTLNVFEPITSFRLEKYIIDVYSYESLGVDYKSLADVNVGTIIGPTTAGNGLATCSTDSEIRGKDCFILYKVSSENNNLIGKNGNYVAHLTSDKTKSTAYVYVTVEKFGDSATLVCTINIKKAPQIEKIDFTVREGEKVKDNNAFTYDKDVTYISTKNGKTLTIDTKIKPNSEKVLVDDLVVKVFKANNSQLKEMITPSETSLASLNYLEEVEKDSVILLSGQDRFTVNINQTESGFFYIAIFARDSMASATSGNLVRKILVEITNGTLENPYVVETIEDLIDISTDPTKHYVMGRDLNLSSYGNWEPLCCDVENGFTGTLNGYNGNIAGKEDIGKFFTISGLKINNISKENNGLFAKVGTSTVMVSGEPKTQYGAIVNLKLEVTNIAKNGNIDIAEKTDINIGGLVGENNGLIMNCAVKADNINIKITDLTEENDININIGGLIGLNKGYIYNFPSGTLLDSKNLGIVEGGNCLVDNYQMGSILESIMDKYFVSLNPVNAKITVEDYSKEVTVGTEPKTVYRIANVGGMVGKMTGGVINGLYGIYNYLEEIQTAGTQYVTTYQSQGNDVNVKINTNTDDGGNIVNSFSSLGGVVGRLESNNTNCKIYNVSSEGQIGYIDGDGNICGALNNLGGIVGTSQGSIDTSIIPNVSHKNNIDTVLTSVKLRGQNYVGGVVGYATLTDLHLVRVENYEVEVEKDIDIALIVSGGVAGGVAGYFENGNINLAYSYSYVNDYNSAYITYGDIYSGKCDDAAYLGGIVGQVDGECTGIEPDVTVNPNVNISKSYSTFNICSGSEVTSTIAGIWAYGTPNSVSNVYYVGVLSAVESGTSVISPLGGDETTTFGGYCFAYVLTYDYDEGTEKYYLKNTASSLTAGTKGSEYNSENIYQFVYYNGSLEAVTISTPVLVYEHNRVTYNFIRSIPDSITVGFNNSKVDEIEKDGENLILAFSEKLFHTYEKDEKTILVVDYSAIQENRTISLNDLLKVTSIPSSIGRLSLVVSSSNPQVLDITDDGKLNILVLSDQAVTIKFTVKENINVTDSIYVYVLKNFDELLLSSLPSFSDNLFDYYGTIEGKTDNYFDIRVNTDFNIFEVLTEYVENKDIKVAVYGYDKDEENALVEIDSKDYTIIFGVESAGAYEEKNGVYQFKTDDETYTISANINFKIGDDNITITNDDWKFFVKAYAGATNIAFNTTEVVMESQEICDDLILSLTTDVSVADYPEYVLYLVDKDGNKYDYNSTNGTFGTSKIKATVTKDTKQSDIYNYRITLYVAPEQKDSVVDLEEYTLYAYDGGEILKDNPARVAITIAPQSLRGIHGIHYAYTQSVSEIITNVNTQADRSEEDNNFAYSFSNEPKNTIVTGSEGLFVLDLYPYYSKITSVSIESSLNEDSGNSLQFVQLVKIEDNTGKSPSGYSYIFAPTTTASEKNGIYLNLLSDVTNAQIKTSGSERIFTSNDFQYSFGEKEDDSEVGRLYVKTVAPTLLRSEESFVVTVTVKYMALDSNGNYKEQTMVYYHTLVVENMSGYNLFVTHDGKERDKIAYTEKGDTPDYLEVELAIDKSVYTNGSLKFSVKNEYGEEKTGIDYIYKEESTPSENLKYKVCLGSKAKAGDSVLITVTLTVDYDGYKQTRTFYREIPIVDLIIENVSIVGASKDENGYETLNMSVSSSKQLRVKISGFGTKEKIEETELYIARMVSYDSGNSISYWYGCIPNTTTYTNLDANNLLRNVSFNVSKITINNKIYYSYDGDNKYNFSQRAILLESLSSFTNFKMRLQFSYTYLTEKYSYNDLLTGKTVNIEKGQLVLLPNEAKNAISFGKEFTLNVLEDLNEDNPIPIYTEADLKDMANKSSGHYILMNDLELSNHTALKANFDSFDGNNKVITIKNFAYSTNLASSNSKYEINLGLFDTVSKDTAIKNVIVALPVRTSDSAMDLTNYSTIVFGGIASTNYGIITNCDVISVSSKENVNLQNYLNTLTSVSYTLNIETSDDVSSASIGLLVGINGSSGIITNSRVGRESVTILQTYENNASVVYKNDYAPTVPIMAVKIFGKANVGGFVATNNGTISSSFVKNLQLEVVSSRSTDYVKTGGFVVENNGFVYGSYVAGWEEENSDYTATKDGNRKLGGGLLSNGFIGGFVYKNTSHIEDCYSNIDCSGNLSFVANTSYVRVLRGEDKSNENWISPAVGGFVYISTKGSYITTSYSLSKISDIRSNTHGAFEGRIGAPDSNFDNSGEVEDCYFMQEEKIESFSFDHEKATKLSDEPQIDLGDSFEEVSGKNEFINEDSFNNFSFDSYFDDINKFSNYQGVSSGGVWAINTNNNISGYPDLISANTIAISCRVISNYKTDKAAINGTYYYTYVDGYELGSYLNPYLISNYTQFNNLFKPYESIKGTNNNVVTKFTGNIRLINNIDFGKCEDNSVSSSSVEYTSLTNMTSIFDGNYLSMHNISITASENRTANSFGLFSDIYYAGVKNLTLIVNSVSATMTTTVGVLAGAIVNSNISNITLRASSGNGTDEYNVIGRNFVGGLAGFIISNPNNETTFKIANIKSNLAVFSNLSSNNSASTALTSSFLLWNRIKPTLNDSGLSDFNGNLKLSKLPTNVCYAGGIAGVIDLASKDDPEEQKDLITPNVYNIQVGELRTTNSILSKVNYTTTYYVHIYSDFAGGVFGLVGSETFVKRARFIANVSNEQHYIRGKKVAGGLVAINFGKINQSYVSFDEETTNNLNDNIIKYMDGSSTDIHQNKTLFWSETVETQYVGGLVGINAGNGQYGSGNIIDCYNRVDVRNKYAIGVGGIVGGSYIGKISNVYTTASLMGDLTKETTKIGAVIGEIFENADCGYFANYRSEDVSKANNDLKLSNIVALNLWDTNDFDSYSSFVDNGGKIGSLYGYYENSNGSDKAFISDLSGVFVQAYILEDYADKEISSDEFSMSKLNSNTYLSLWGLSDDDFLYKKLCSDDDKSSMIMPNDIRALFSKTDFSVSDLREVYFSSSKWSREVWNYDDDILLPILEYGYESSIVRIYNAEEFFEKINQGNSSGKLYVIMNDIDFNGYTVDMVNNNCIRSTFRGQLYGNNVKYTNEEEEGKTWTRKPILFNLNFENSSIGSNSCGLFTSASGATFANFNIVVSGYNVGFGSSGSETIASVLIAEATNCSFQNIHIYSSLDDTVDEDILKNNFKIKSIVTLDSPYITQGYLLDEDGYLKETYSDKFLRLAEYDGDGKVKDKIYLYDQVAILDCKEISVTKVSTVGLLIGVGSLPTVANCSVNLNIKVNLSGYANIYVGAISGRTVGTFGSAGCIVSTSNITISNTSDSPSGHSCAYIGGIVGSFKGIFENVFVKNSTITIGKNSIPLTVASGIEGLFIGGLAGALDIYSTLNDAFVGYANNLRLLDSKINTYVEGPSKIGGITGANGFRLENAYVIQTKGNENGIIVNVKNESTTLSLGGIIGANSYTGLNNLGNNVDITLNYSKIGYVEVGGIIGKSNFKTNLTSVVNDAQNITIVDVSTDKCLDNKKACVGGILGSCHDYDIEMEDVFSSTNIDSCQFKEAYFGGLIGFVGGVAKANKVICLGDITLNRTSKMFDFFEEQYIGGAFGSCDQDINNSQDLLVLSTIRDYALAQKKDVQIGPVFGVNGNYPKSYHRDIFFNENISLVSDNGYNEVLTNLEQGNWEKSGSLYSKFKKIFETMVEEKCFARLKGVSNFKNTYFSNGFVKFSGEGNNFKSGSKLNPIEYNSGVNFEANKYYIMTSDVVLSSQISTDKTNWVLNAQGYSFVSSDKTSWESNNSIFSTIPEGCAVVGLLENVVVSGAEGNYAIIAYTNNGFIFACGVSGSISGRDISSFVYQNDGVISSSFSNADLTTTYQGAYGLVNQNGNSNIGNIYNSYYTGTISTTGSNVQRNLAGIAWNTAKGAISNCYTMADFDLVGITFSGGGAYPVCYYQNVGKGNVYKTFYDYVAYAGSYEGMSIDNAKKTTYNYLTNCGIYVWSSSLAGSSSGVNKITNNKVTDIINGSWLKPADNSQIVEMYKKTDNYIINSSEDVLIDTSWFNYGYMTINMSNILVNNGDHSKSDTDDNIMKYLQMLYTGNGLADKDGKSNIVKNAKTTPTNGFENGPYQVEHAGILDLLVCANNTESGINYKYYLLTKNIDFIKYTKETYWSETWDNLGIAFVGELDGNSKKIVNMYSSYGLLRAMPYIEGTYQSQIKNVTFENCYSKTGIVAGFLNGEDDKTSITGVTLNYCVVLNGVLLNGEQKLIPNTSTTSVTLTNTDFTDTIYNSISFKIGTDDPKNPSKDDFNFAGGLVGYMAGGKIENINYSNIVDVVASDKVTNKTTTTTAIAGGLVGYMAGGKICGASAFSKLSISKVYVYILSSGTESSCPTENYAGGIVGKIAGGTIQYVGISNSEVCGSYAVGGIVGGIEGGAIENCISTLSSINVGNKGFTPSSSNFEFGDKVIKVKEICGGGIAGYMTGGVINECNEASDSLTFISWKDGNGDRTKGNGETSLIICDNTVTPKPYVACGGIVGLINSTSGGIVSSCVIGSSKSSYSLTLENIDNCVNILGGIVGQLDSTKDDKYLDDRSCVYGCMNYAIVTSSQMAGGIVGQMVAGVIGKSGSVNSNNADINAGIAGGVVGRVLNEGSCTIQYCTLVKGQIKGVKSGGIVGEINAQSSLVTIDNCNTQNEASIGDSSKSTISGGIVGLAYGYVTIKNTLNSSKVTVKFDETNKNTFAGGVVGYSYGSTGNVITIVGLEKDKGTGKGPNTGDVTGGYVSGGIVGYAENTILTSENTGSKGEWWVWNNGNVKGYISGGIVGFAGAGTTLKGKIVNSDSSSSKNVETISYSDTLGPNSPVEYGIAGGIIGFANSLIVDHENTTNGQFINFANVGDTTTNIAGGIVGYIYNGNPLILMDVSNYGSVKATAESNEEYVYEYCFNIDDLKKSKILTIEIKKDKNICPKCQNAAGGIVGYVNSSLSIVNARLISGGKYREVYSLVCSGGIVGYANQNTTITSSSNGIYTTDGSGKLISNAGMTIVGKFAGGIISEVTTNVNLYAYYEDDYGNIETEVTETINGEEITFEPGSVFNLGEVKGEEWAGGIAGKMTGGKLQGGNDNKYIIFNNGKIYCTTEGLDHGAGGIVGYYYSTGSNSFIGYCISNGNVYSYDYSDNKYINSNIGGLVGYMTAGEIKNTCEVGLITVDGGTVATAGGLVGYRNGAGEIKNKVASSYWTVDTVKGKIAGGMIGVNSDTASNEVNGNISISGRVEGSDYSGGLIGENDSAGKLGGEVKLIYNSSLKTASVMAITDAGGAVGMNSNGTINVIVSGNGWIQTTSSGEYGSYAGGLVGHMIGGTISGGQGGGAVASNGQNASAGGLVGCMSYSEKDGNKYTGGSITGGTGGNATSSVYAGGIVGWILGAGSVSDGATGGFEVKGKYAGGVVGLLSAYNSYVPTLSGGTAQGTCYGQDSAGGVVGWVANATVSGGTGSAVGYKEATNTDPSYKATYLGGIVGKMTGESAITNGTGGTVSISNSYSLESSSSVQIVGGIVGYMMSGKVTGGTGGSVTNGYWVGGIVGWLQNGEVSGGTSGEVKGGSRSGGVAGMASGGTISCGPSNNVTGLHAGGVLGQAGIGGVVIIGVSEVKEVTITAGEAKGSGGLIGLTAPYYASGGTWTTVGGGEIKLSTGNSVLLSSNIVIKCNCAAGIVNSNAIVIKSNDDAAKRTITFDKANSLVIYNGSILKNIIRAGTVSGTGKEVGGIVSINDDDVKENSRVGSSNNAQIIDCENKASISGLNVGGICYNNAGTITNCVNNTSITGTGTGNVGGIAGMNSGTITGCENTSSITGTGTGNVGGIAGENTGNISTCENKGSISYSGSSVNTGASTDWFEDSNYSTTPSYSVGGIVGLNDGGSVSGKNSGTISNNVYYNTKDGIKDYRGQIAGKSPNGGSVVNENGHTEYGFTVNVETIEGKTTPIPEKYYVVVVKQKCVDGQNKKFTFTQYIKELESDPSSDIKLQFGNANLIDNDYKSFSEDYTRVSEWVESNYIENNNEKFSICFTIDNIEEMAWSLLEANMASVDDIELFFDSNNNQVWYRDMANKVQDIVSFDSKGYIQIDAFFLNPFKGVLHTDGWYFQATSGEKVTDEFKNKAIEEVKRYVKDTNYKIDSILDLRFMHDVGDDNYRNDEYNLVVLKHAGETITEDDTYEYTVGESEHAVQDCGGDVKIVSDPLGGKISYALTIEALYNKCQCPDKTSGGVGATVGTGTGDTTKYQATQVRAGSAELEQKVFTALYKKFGDISAVAAFMGNIAPECNFDCSLNESDSNSTSYTQKVDSGKISKEEFISSGKGYGLIQWTNKGRKEKLYNYWQANKQKYTSQSIGCLEMQVDFMYEEFQDYPGLMTGLYETEKSVENKAIMLMLQYVKPKNQSLENQQTRAGYARKIYDQAVKCGVEGGGSGGTIVEVAQKLAQYGNITYKIGNPCYAKQDAENTYNNALDGGTSTDCFGFVRMCEWIAWQTECPISGYRGGTEITSSNVNDLKAGDIIYNADSSGTHIAIIESWNGSSGKVIDVGQWKDVCGVRDIEWNGSYLKETSWSAYNGFKYFYRHP